MFDRGRGVQPAPLFSAGHDPGIDINPRNIARAQASLRHLGDDRLSFSIAASAGGEGLGNHDAVFAMAIFRHGELGDFPPTCSHLLRFADFEQSLTELAACLKPGGLLFLRHASFRFQDTALAQEFDLLLEKSRAASRSMAGTRRCCPANPGLKGSLSASRGGRQIHGMYLSDYRRHRVHDKLD